MAQSHFIRGGHGLNLHVCEWGDPAGAPILFIHGWSASHLAWSHQYESALADEFRLVALDLRGHGMSDKPLDVGHYAEARPWADDVAGVIDELDLARPILVGWSYGGLVIGDYVRTHGDGAISGVNYVGGAVVFNEAVLSTLFGPGFLDHVGPATDPDLSANIAAVRSFLHELVATPMSQEEHERALAFNMVVPPRVRAAVLQREVDSDDVLGAMRVPVLVTHGEEDRHVLPGMAEHVLEVCPTARASWYEGVAHMPFAEQPQRFNAELAAFAREAR